MTLGPNSNILTSGYSPAYTSGLTWFYKLSVTNSSTRLGSLITTAGGAGIPLITNELYTASQNDTILTRPPWHVFFQVAAAAANPVYCTWDNNTAPVVGGPGMEFEPGVVYRFENAGNSLLRAKASGIYLVNAGSAFLFIATAATVMNVGFSD